MLFMHVPKHGRVEFTKAPLHSGAHNGLVYYAMNLQNNKQLLKAVLERDSIYGLPMQLEGADY